MTTGWVYAKGLEITKKAGDYTVAINMGKTPFVGNNNLEVAVKDAKGNAVTNAAVAIDYGMPAMPGMPAMNYTAKATAADGKYKAVLDLSMSGPWTATVKIAKGGQDADDQDYDRCEIEKIEIERLRS